MTDCIAYLSTVGAAVLLLLIIGGYIPSHVVVGVIVVVFLVVVVWAAAIALAILLYTLDLFDDLTDSVVRGCRRVVSVFKRG